MSADHDRLRRLGRLMRIAALQEEMARVPLVAATARVRQLEVQAKESRLLALGARNDLARAASVENAHQERRFVHDDMRRAGAFADALDTVREGVERSLPPLQEQFQVRRVTHEQMQGLHDRLHSDLRRQQERRAAAEADELALQKTFRERRRSKEARLRVRS